MRRTLLWLLDNSVIQRLRLPAVYDSVQELAQRGSIASCLPQTLAEGYSARNPEDHRLVLNGNLLGKVMLAPMPGMVQIAIDIQRRLFAAGLGRGAGAFDIEIAATAIAHSSDGTEVTVVHYDNDFDQIGRVCPEFQHQWVAPRASLPY